MKITKLQFCNRSPFSSGRPSVPKYEPSYAESDISYVSSGRPSTDSLFPAFADQLDYYGMNGRFSDARLSVGSELDNTSIPSLHSGSNKSLEFSCSLRDSGNIPPPSPGANPVRKSSSVLESGYIKELKKLMYFDERRMNSQLLYFYQNNREI